MKRNDQKKTTADNYDRTIGRNKSSHTNKTKIFQNSEKNSTSTSMENVLRRINNQM